jgi:ATP-dependent Clp protease ATP-binding subunit ClpC
MEPVIVLLSHPWFGAEEAVSAVPSLRGLFVQYPGQQIRPALARACERWESVNTGQVELDVLARILG